MIEDREIIRKEAVSTAIRHIGTGIYSSGKIRTYIINKGYPSDVADEAVRELKSRGYIDDLRAGRKVLYARTGKKQESRRLLSVRLEQAGVPAGEAGQLLEELDDDLTLCSMLLEETYGSDSDHSDDDLAGFIKLAERRGFSFETAVRAFRRSV